MCGMKISIKVKTNAKETKVEKLEGSNYIVKVKTAPIEGKANEAVIKALSEFFDVPKSNIAIKSGLASKQKIVEIIGL